jgi:hypothetical protein
MTERTEGGLLLALTMLVHHSNGYLALVRNDVLVAAEWLLQAVLARAAIR